MSNYSDSVKALLENTTEEFLQASEILIRFCNNVINNPTAPKYRRLRVGNPIIQNKLLTVSGGMECLFDMGFLEDGEYLSLPAWASLDPLKQIRDNLLKEREKHENLSVSSGSASSPAVVQPGAGANTSVQLNRPYVFRKEMEFFSQLQSRFNHVLIYEDPQLQQKARASMPVDQFEKEADDKYRQLQAQNAGGVDKRDLLLLSVLHWFKTSFFSWVNSPACNVCGGETQKVGDAQPFPEELKWGGNRVEQYRCNTCSTVVRFPRYNHPGKLLETRKGRCGEWANCFTLCCRALGFEARFVLDWTDHVWTEVYSEREKRWLHCDPCENICDKPLLYESGWGKKLSYIIAFSKDDIQDVSWRYSRKHDELKQRRGECRESWLVTTITKLRHQRQAGFPEAHRKLLNERCARELVELLLPQPDTSEQLPGRISGSVAWRLARGELGDQAPVSEPYVFNLSPEEKSSKTFHLRYNCASDKYTVVSSGRVQEKWESGVYMMTNVIRKVEQDWNMVYLARREGAATAEISWKFDFSGLKIDTVTISPGSSTFENGVVSWSLCGDDQCVLLKASQPNVVTDLKGKESMVLTAYMSGGQGNVAWQHTQLFRQSTSDTGRFPLDIHVTFAD
ncbi:peptide-N(4)-(N-acetyl-beta-glucosaminyl)asparagine amidase-like [Liolophura sinensis]|uniref:peptide-N(4)-(N-acetyl-beta- glucosaminyl)asparagine amidase-like n=1 Tax=Liolophura sinensis TaxID=3198878 RepID=UPI0031582460